MKRDGKLRSATLLAVLGVVYGDIGTSPLYAVKASLDLFRGHTIEEWEILGIISLIVWSLIVVVTIKYVLLVMRADNRGEGGILAITALAQRATQGRMQAILGLIGIIGACLFFGDGLITPAISVLSAVEGMEISVPAARPFILPLSTAIIIGLFAMQSRGTGSVGKIFGPVMVAWFAMLGGLGIAALIHHPAVLSAVLPYHAVVFCWYHGWGAFVVLGSVVLAVTGAEALYADMGHFGARPIQISWIGFVLPCLMLNYMGQGALVLTKPETAVNPFFLICPPMLQIPMVVLATMASVIASQAMITGAFSMARQCMQLDILPRMRVRHTSSDEEGQIYLPQVNMMLLVGVLILVLMFRSSDALASAYGIAVTGTFMCTCVAAGFVFRSRYHWSAVRCVLVFGGFLLIDGSFFAANTLKIVEGGYVPLLIATVLTAVMTSWRRGRRLVLDRMKHDSLPLSSFLARLPKSSIHRIPGVAVFMSSNAAVVPPALLHNLKHNKVLHEKVVFVTIENLDVPYVEGEARVTVTELIPQIFRVILRFGFMESPNIPRSLEAIEDLHFESMKASYFLGRGRLVSSKVPKLPFWRMWLFLTMTRNASSPMDVYHIPSDRVVELGVRIAI
jgi:KUP system potassium uptake protein